VKTLPVWADGDGVACVVFLLGAVVRCFHCALRLCLGPCALLCPRCWRPWMSLFLLKASLKHPCVRASIRSPVSLSPELFLAVPACLMFFLAVVCPTLLRWFDLPLLFDVRFS
jgi:hypothetical protein